jgi:hypothetical protein
MHMLTNKQETNHEEALALGKELLDRVAALVVAVEPAELEKDAGDCVQLGDKVGRQRRPRAQIRQKEAAWKKNFRNRKKKPKKKTQPHYLQMWTLSGASSGITPRVSSLFSVVAASMRA